MIGAKRLRTRAGSGIYQTGRERVTQILETALDIIIESGYQALTLREVARRCSIQIGAVTYYYTSRSDLLQDVLNMVRVPYAESIGAWLFRRGLAGRARGGAREPSRWQYPPPNGSGLICLVRAHASLLPVAVDDDLAAHGVAVSKGDAG